jgi:hypothetical protein
LQGFRDTSRQLNGLCSSLEEEAIDARVAKTFGWSLVFDQFFNRACEKRAVATLPLHSFHPFEVPQYTLPIGHRDSSRPRFSGDLGTCGRFSHYRFLDRVIGSLDSFDLFDSQAWISRLKNSFILRDLAGSRVWHPICLCKHRQGSRVTDAPEIDETTLGAHFPSTEQRPDPGASVTRLKRKGR